MKCLSVHQPHATALVRGIQTILTRSWTVPSTVQMPFTMAVVSTATTPADWFYRIIDEFDWEDGWEMGSLGDKEPAVVVCRASKTCDAPTGMITMYVPRPDGTYDGPIECPPGVLLGTVEVTDCVPITLCEMPSGDSGVVVCNDRATFEHVYYGSDDITDQLPWGNFTAGRFAWICENPVEYPEPIPAKGRQRLWSWSPDA